MKKICIIDGQGGGIGSTIIRKLKDTFSESVELIAIGTNAVATAQMLKAGSNKGASGENAIIHTVKTVDLIIGPVGIIFAHAFLGELTAKAAEAVAESPAKKILLPLSQENIEIVGTSSEPLPHLVDKLIEKHLKHYIYNQS